MKDFILSADTLDDFNTVILAELKDDPELLVSSQNAKVGKWGMAKLWRAWMKTTADYMAFRGCIMPLFIKTDGSSYGERPFNKDDAHELFTAQWLGCDENGDRLSWSKKGRNGMRPATKGERFHAMQQHEEWCLSRAIIIIKPNDSEYSNLAAEQNK